VKSLELFCFSPASTDLGTLVHLALCYLQALAHFLVEYHLSTAATWLLASRYMCIVLADKGIGYTSES